MKPGVKVKYLMSAVFFHPLLNLIVMEEEYIVQCFTKF